MIRFETDFAEIETGVVWQTPLSDRTSIEAEVAVGVRATQTDTHVNSALLNVRNSGSQADT